MNKVKIEQTEYGYKVSVNGLDVSNYVVHVDISLDAKRRRVAIVELTMPAELEMPEEVEAEVNIIRRDHEK